MDAPPQSAGDLAGGAIYSLLFANNFGTNTVLLIAVGGHAIHWHSFVDVALLYAMVNFVITIAIMRYFEAKPTKRRGGATEDA